MESMGFEIITDENIFEIHKNACELLSSYGLKVKSKNLIRLLQSRNFKVNFKDSIVKIPYDIQEKYLQMVPKSHSISGWDIKNRLNIKIN